MTTPTDPKTCEHKWANLLCQDDGHVARIHDKPQPWDGVNHPVGDKNLDWCEKCGTLAYSKGPYGNSTFYRPGELQPPRPLKLTSEQQDMLIDLIRKT